jgi:SAM-dependent methyltransferase
MTDATAYLARIEAGIAATGLDRDALTAADLAPVDQFHVRGLEAVEDLIRSSGIGSGDRVLDIGAGTGGPARILATRTGCMVTGVDLSPVSIAAGTAMTDWTGLSEKVDLRTGDATALPFDDATFDAAWSVHVGMFVKSPEQNRHLDGHRARKPLM